MKVVDLTSADDREAELVYFELMIVLERAELAGFNQASVLKALFMVLEDLHEQDDELEAEHLH